MTKTTDADLLAALEAESPSASNGTDWKPTEVGETVIGEVVRFEHPKTKSGRTLPIVVLNDDESEIRVAAMHTILRSELLERRVQIGDRVAIRYLGQPEGKRYFVYRVAVAEAGPRAESLAFRLEPQDDELLPEALAVSEADEEGAWS